MGPIFYSIPASQRVYDEQEGADTIYAYLKGAQELGVESFNIWSFSAGDIQSEWGSTANLLNSGFKLPITPAYRVIKAIIGPEE